MPMTETAQELCDVEQNWDVYSDATVKLITSAVGVMERDKTLGRAVSCWR